MTDFPEDPSPDEDPESLIDSINDLYARNQEVLEAIHLLESELEAVEDPVGMYITLFDLYSDIESMQDAGRALVEAARRVHADFHPDLAYFLYNQLELFAQLLPEGREAYERLGHLIATDDDVFSPDTMHLDQRKLGRVDLIPEILLAQHLLRSHVISESEFRQILQDLCWCDGKPQAAPRCCLYVLHDRELPHEDKALEFLMHDASTPFLDLAAVTPDPEWMQSLPLDTCVRRGACVFGAVGGEPMVAVLNPFNLRLKEDVARILDGDQHFFLTSAGGYEHALGRMRGEIEV